MVRNTTYPQIFGPDGRLLTLAQLPETTTLRWSMQRKGRVVAAVRAGLLSMEEACERYAISVDEFLAWQSAMQKRGLAGLRVTRRPVANKTKLPA